MLRVLRGGLALALLIFGMRVLPTQQQGDLQTLVDDLFPGQYWIEIDGTLSNDSVMTQRVTEPGINNIRQFLWPFGVGNPLLSDPDQNDFGLSMDATIHDPESPDDLSWATVAISFDNILGQPPQQYDIVSREATSELSEDTPRVSAHVLLPHRDRSRFQFIHNIEGEAYVEEQREDDVIDWRIAFEFIVENELNEAVHVRGAVYGRRYRDWIPDMQPGEVEVALSGEVAADGTDALNIQASPNEDGTLDFIFESEFVGSRQTAPDDIVPFNLLAEATLNEPEVCEPTYAQLTAEYGTVLLTVAGEPFEIADSLADPPVISICFEDTDKTTVSGIVDFREFAPDRLDEYIDFVLYFRAIPISPPADLAVMLDGLSPNTYVVSLDGALISEGAFDAGVYEEYEGSVPSAPLSIRAGDDRAGETRTLYIPVVGYAPSTPDVIFPIGINFGFRNTHGDPPATYAITQLDTLEESERHHQRPTVDVTLIARKNPPFSDIYSTNPQGRLYLRQTPVGDNVEYRVAFEFTVANSEGEIVQGRGAAFLVGPLLY